MQIYLRKYATSGTVDFDLYSTDGTTILTSAAFASGCCVISLDNGTSAKSVNVPIVTQNGFKINFTSDELTTKRLHAKFVDTNSTASWLSHSFIVESYGTSASQHGDLASGLLDNIVDTVSIRQIITEAMAVLVGNIIKNGDNYAHLSRDNSTTVVSLSAALENRVRN